MIEARTVDEAYSSACNTSNLSVKAEQRNDADVLISSGMTPGLLGAALLRLHSEWDGTAKVVAPSLTPDSYTQQCLSCVRSPCCSSLSHPG